jgi:hypothetical protein
MTDKLKSFEFDAITGITIDRELSEEETDSLSESNSQEQRRLLAEKSVKTSAFAKLAALGLTEEEIAAL